LLEGQHFQLQYAEIYFSIDFSFLDFNIAEISVLAIADYFVKDFKKTGLFFHESSSKFYQEITAQRVELFRLRKFSDINFCRKNNH